MKLKASSPTRTSTMPTEMMTVSKLPTGWAAIHMVWVDENGGYWDVYQTGIGRYPTRGMARVEALSWAKMEGIPVEETLKML